MKTRMFTFLAALAFVAACGSSDSNEPVVSADQQNREFQVQQDTKHSQVWTAEERQRANTAASATYLTQVEKEVYYYLNLLRIDPLRFANSYVKDYQGVMGWKNGNAFDERKQSLLTELASLRPMPLLRPNEMLFESAECFATNGGRLGVVGHNRAGTGCNANVGLAECTGYGGYVTGLSIVMDFLIDAGESNINLGHRRILLNQEYEWMGVALRDFKDYAHMIVIDLDSRDL
ncbi:MAG: hypothetical protein IJ570_08635 [Prevotella sp.]|nr:hypothetical protein [Prevotella sp.]